jgi:hypothetical protein
MLVKGPIMHQGVIEHVLPGRMRLRFREQRGNIGFFQELVQRLEQLPEVERVLANPLTGSILIFHGGSPREIAAYAVSVEVKPPASPGPPQPPRRTAQTRVWAPEPIRLALCGLAVYQLARGRLASNAAQQFWYAGRAAALQQQPLAIGLAVLGLLQGLGGRWLAPASSFLMYALLSDNASNERRKAPTTLRTIRFARLRHSLPGSKHRLG